MSTDLIDFPSASYGFIQPGDNNGRAVPMYYELADYLIKRRGFKTIGKYNWIYDKTHYVQISDEMLGKIIIDLTHKKASPSWVTNFVKITRFNAQINRDDFKTPQGLLNVANGVVDIKNKTLLPHTDAFHFKYVTPIEFNSDAQCPNFMNFLDFVFQGDKELIDVTAEIYGYCLLGGDPFLHKAFVLLGDGRNGKSTWLHVLRCLLGHDNCSSVSMGLLNKPFSAVSLEGKLANITGELPNGKIDSETFKTAVGGEFLTAAHKGKDEFGLKCEARFVFACNDMPRFGDATTGMWEKLYMMPFGRYITENERDPGIFKQLENELSGVLNFALDGLSSLIKRRKLPKISSTDKILNDYRAESDSVYEFYNDRLEICAPNNIIRLWNTDVHKIYENYCRNSRRMPTNPNEFSKRLRRLLKEKNELGVTVITDKGNRGRWYEGLRYQELGT